MTSTVAYIVGGIGFAVVLAVAIGGAVIRYRCRSSSDLEDFFDGMIGIFVAEVMILAGLGLFAISIHLVVTELNWITVDPYQALANVAIAGGVAVFGIIFVYLIGITLIRMLEDWW